MRVGGGDHLRSVVRGCAVPETLAWSGTRLTALVDGAGVGGLVVVTLRAFDDRSVPPGMPVLVDFVDRLSESYRQRAAVDRRPVRRLGWDVLARAHARTESRIRDGRSWSTAAAGRADAEALGATWLPITIAEADFDDDDGATFDDDDSGDDSGARRHRTDLEPAIPPDVWSQLGSNRRWDLLFAGTLDYPPNVDAVRALARDIMPGVRVARPGVTLCVAGRRPTPEVRRLARAMGADLVEGFGSYHELAANARVAVAPLRHATGLQIKVLDAARARLPQVVTPAVAKGFDSQFPVRVAPVGPDFIAAVLRLLDDPESAGALASAAWSHTRRCYSTEHWVGEVDRHIAEMLDGRT